MNVQAPVQRERSGCIKGGPLLQVASWINRILFLSSIALGIIDFTVAHTTIFGIFYMVIAIFGFLSPLTFSCCYAWTFTNCTKMNEFCGRMMMYVWLFLSNIAYVVIFAYTWSDGWLYVQPYVYFQGYTHYDAISLRQTLFALLLIYTFTYSILNMYIICLVSKFGCCFVEGLEGEINNRSQNTEAQPLQVVIPPMNPNPNTSMQAMAYPPAATPYVAGVNFQTPPYTETASQPMASLMTSPTTPIDQLQDVDHPPPYSKTKLAGI